MPLIARTSGTQARRVYVRAMERTREGKCGDGVEKELKLPKYESWPGYQNGLPFVLRRYCGLWGRGT